MAENSRIDDLRRRVQKDPASIAFAQLAEECRRAREYQEAVDTCRAGLAIHPGYLSARVTLGRALIELGQLDEAEAELSHVLGSAPENLAAIRGLAEIYHRRGDLTQALAQYRAALSLARNDPDLEETIADLSRQVEPAKAEPSGGLSMQHMQDELRRLAPPRAQSPPSVPSAVFPRSSVDPVVGVGPRIRLQADNPAKAGSPEPVRAQSPPSSPNTQSAVFSASSVDPVVDVGPRARLQADNPVEADGDEADGMLTAAADDRATRTVAALEQWLAAIHVSREQRHP